MVPSLLRNRLEFLWPLKSNIRFREPAEVSAAPLPMAGRFQFSSMNFTTELWSLSELATKSGLAYREMTSSGSRGPNPHRPCSGWLELFTGTSAAEPHWPVPVSVSCEVCSALVIGPSPWSDQPSESSQPSTTAAD